VKHRRTWQLVEAGRTLARAAPVWTAVWLAFVVLRGILPTLLMIGVGRLVADLAAARSPVASFAWFAVCFFLLQIATPIHGTVGATLGIKLAENLQGRLLRAALENPGIDRLESPRLQDDLTRARDFDIGLSRPPLYAAVAQLAIGAGQFAGGVVGAVSLSLYFEWWTGPAAAAAWGLAYPLLKRAASWADWRSDESTAGERVADYAYRVAVEPASAKEVRLFGLSDWIVTRFVNARTRVAELAIARSRLGRLPLAGAIVLVLLANVAIATRIVLAGLAGTISLGQVTTSLGLLATTGALGFGEFVTWYRMVADLAPKLAQLETELTATGSTAALATGRTLPRGRSTAGAEAAEIRLQGVRFGYPLAGTAAPVLTGVDLTIPAGTSLGLVGANGAGKTTLVKLLCRLYDPTAGRILVGDQVLSDLDPRAWQSRIAVIFQDFVRYERSLRDNVAPAGAPDGLILDCLTLAGAPSGIGLDTVLSEAYEGGIDLSGGQWQRVALARALCSVRLGAGLLVLDEPTAQLDVRGEAEVYGQPVQGYLDRAAALRAVDAGATVVFSTVEHWVDELSGLVRDLGAAWRSACTASIFCTPASSTGLTWHRDDQHGLVLQLEGSKVWNVERSAPTGAWREETLGASFEPDSPVRLELRPGDALYLPPGVAHHPETQESASVHVTIGLMQVSVLDVAQRLLLTSDALRHRPAADGADVVAVLREALGSVPAGVAEDCAAAAEAELMGSSWKV
jgi:ATP-binding cassette subfamily B protein